MTKLLPKESYKTKMVRVLALHQNRELTFFKPNTNKLRAEKISQSKNTKKKESDEKPSQTSILSSSKFTSQVLAAFFILNYYFF